MITVALGMLYNDSSGRLCLVVFHCVAFGKNQCHLLTQTSVILNSPTKDATGPYRSRWRSLDYVCVLRNNSNASSGGIICKNPII